MAKQKPFAVIAHKGDEFGGVSAVDVKADLLTDFLLDMVRDGFNLKTVFSRDEYDAVMATLR